MSAPIDFNALRAAVAREFPLPLRARALALLDKARAAFERDDVEAMLAALAEQRVLQADLTNLIQRTTKGGLA